MDFPYLRMGENNFCIFGISPISHSSAGFLKIRGFKDAFEDWVERQFPAKREIKQYPSVLWQERILHPKSSLRSALRQALSYVKEGSRAI